ncbi:glycoside hydrolase family 3 C-terminal domain-containing protein, partial [Streptomyces sp. NPDC006129]|uniref:glycoside hydrolase family 3 C-terminal domain-containing protein n=1 Tax=Streptomyces sp. NPDC006129 TaxID=3155348 RepID=UPI0033AF72B6
ALVDAVRWGEADEADVDRAGRRVLRQKVALGLLDPDWDPEPPALRAGALDLDKPENRELAHAVARSSAVLLSNDGVLPLPSRGRIALIGPCADDVRTMFGCYSFPNHVLSDRDDLGNGVEAVSLRTALAAELPGVEWEFMPGCPVREEDRSGIPAAARASAAADLTVLVVGDKPGMFGIGTSGEGCDVEDLRLPGVQEELVEAVLATGRPVVLVVNSGRPYAVGRFAHAAAAMVQVFLPGEEGGRAVAELLSGAANFSGKLPVQIPASPAGQPYTYLHPPLGDRQSWLSNLDPTPAFPFGHGLSYTVFEIGHLTVDREQVPTDGRFGVRVRVRNTGEVPGAETVQLYFTDPVAQVTRPVRALLAFAKVELEPGEQATVRFDVHTDRLAFTGLEGHRIVEPGEILLYAGSSSGDTPAEAKVELVGAVRDLTAVRQHGVPVSVERE